MEPACVFEVVCTNANHSWHLYPFATLIIGDMSHRDGAHVCGGIVVSIAVFDVEYTRLIC